MKTGIAREGSLFESLIGLPANACDLENRFPPAGRILVYGFGGQSKHRFKQVDTGIPDLKLGRVNSYSDTPGAGIDVIPREPTLAPCVQGPVGIEREWMSGDDAAVLNTFQDRWRNIADSHDQS
jgi:hypothetical protein